MFKIALPVGALFDYMAGELPRAPRWMTEHGLEWLGRLIQEPRRLWRRYLTRHTTILVVVTQTAIGISPGRLKR